MTLSFGLFTRLLKLMAFACLAGGIQRLEMVVLSAKNSSESMGFHFYQLGYVAKQPNQSAMAYTQCA